MESYKETISYVTRAAMRFVCIYLVYLISISIMLGVPLRIFMTPFWPSCVYVIANFIFLFRLFKPQHFTSRFKNEEEFKSLLFKITWLSNFILLVIEAISLLQYFGDSDKFISTLIGSLVSLFINSIFYFSLYLTPIKETTSLYIRFRNFLDNISANMKKILIFAFVGASVSINLNSCYKNYHGGQMSTSYSGVAGFYDDKDNKKTILEIKGYLKFEQEWRNKGKKEYIQIDADSKGKCRYTEIREPNDYKSSLSQEDCEIVAYDFAKKTASIQVKLFTFQVSDRNVDFKQKTSDEKFVGTLVETQKITSGFW